MTEKPRFGPANPHPFAVKKTELIWEGKYDDDGKRVAPLRVALPLQTVETVEYTDAAGNLRYYEPDFVAVLGDGKRHIENRDEPVLGFDQQWNDADSLVLADQLFGPEETRPPLKLGWIWRIAAHF